MPPSENILLDAQTGRQVSLSFVFASSVIEEVCLIRFHSLFQPLYKVHENFVRVFLGKQFWRRHKRLFHEARTLISADMTHAIFDEGSSSDESEGSEDGS